MILSLFDCFYHLGLFLLSFDLLLLWTAIFRLLIVTSKVERSVADLMVANFLVQKRVSFICWQWNLPRPHQSRAVWLSDSYLHQSCAERERLSYKSISVFLLQLLYRSIPLSNRLLIVIQVIPPLTISLSLSFTVKMINNDFMPNISIRRFPSSAKICWSVFAGI